VLAEAGEGQPINHGVVITTLAEFFKSYIAFDISGVPQAKDWLSISDQKLLTIMKGEVWRDDLGLESIRKTLAYYPHDVWLYVLACQWHRIGQEEHLMGRAGIVGDEIGSGLIAGRLVQSIMRLCFTLEKTYAPYPKWFGTSFGRLQGAGAISPYLAAVQQATRWQERESSLCKAYEAVAQIQNSLQVAEPIEERASRFHDRPFRVINAGHIGAVIMRAVTNEAVLRIATRGMMGSIDQISDNTDLLSDASLRSAVVTLYE
jgi:hypothetical protein